jgi:hypothetical protein
MTKVLDFRQNYLFVTSTSALQTRPLNSASAKGGYSTYAVECFLLKQSMKLHYSEAKLFTELDFIQRILPLEEKNMYFILCRARQTNLYSITSTKLVLYDYNYMLFRHHAY